VNEIVPEAAPPVGFEATTCVSAEPSAKMPIQSLSVPGMSANVTVTSSARP
jgi:hypothetical protein